MAGTAPDVLTWLKETCARITGPDGAGTGYLIAPKRLATAGHVVKSWRDDDRYPVVVGFDGPTVQARLIKADHATDAAVLGFDEDVAATPLPVADALMRKALWEAYGFPATAAVSGFVTGVPIDGHVQDSSTRDDAGHPALLLYSDMVAAGDASPLHGFSGSPILVGGAVVGHLTKHLGDPDDRRRASYGLVYACPVSAVRALLDVPPTMLAINPPALHVLADAVPQIGESAYHVFVSYRSTDRPWAMSLVARLEGAGLRVFIDQRELEPGAQLAAQLQSALSRSRAAVLLVSRGWLASGWCQEEANVLIKRAAEDRSFTLIPLRLDGSVMPPFLDSRVWLDFNATARAEGESLDRLLYQLVGQRQPAAKSPDGRVASADARVVDEFVQEIRAAAHNDVFRVRKVIEVWRRVGSSDATPLVTAAEVFVGQNRPDLALEALSTAPDTLRVRQLMAFALRKTGAIDEAVERLAKLQSQGELDAETGGLLAGSYKARWTKSGNRAFLLEAYRVYRETYERTGDPFNGINAAAMALHAGEQPYRCKAATDVRDALLPRSGTLDYWGLATIGEAWLLLERIDDARDWYRRAAGAAAGRHQDIAVMRRQARLNLAALGQPSDRLDGVLPVPRVLAYFGHMVDLDRPTPRFAPDKVGVVRQAIRRRLADLGPLYGFGTAARGSDILFLETLLERESGATVVLPFPVADFLAVSGGGRWDERFRAIQAHPRIEIQVLRTSRPPDAELPRAFMAANREVQRLASTYARGLDETPVVVAVWNRQPGDGPGGTADAVTLWQEEGYDVDVIDPQQL